jgi:hypothetical protein
MSAKPYTYKESDARRAVRVARKAGLKVVGFHVKHDGIIVMTEGAVPQAPPPNPWDKKDDHPDADGPPRTP